MPAAGNLTPPSDSGPSLRHAATAPNLRFMIPNRYANLDADSPVISPSPPPHSTMPVKFFPLPSKYGQLTGSSFSNLSMLSTSPKKDGEMHGPDTKPAFTVGHDDSHEDYSSHYNKLQIPSTVIHTCDSPAATPRGTPSGSPSLLRRILATDNSTVPDSASKNTGGFFGWLTRPGSAQAGMRPQTEEPTFFHQKEDMSIVQGLMSKNRLAKPRKLPVSMSDVNVFTPTEY